MHTFRAELIVLALCVPGMLLAPSLAQTASPSQGGTAIQAAPSVDSRMGAPVDNRSTSTPVDARVNGGSANGTTAAPASTPATSTMPPPQTGTTGNYILGPEDQITVSVFGADDINARAVTIANDGNVTLPMIGQVHAAGLAVDQFQSVLVAAYKKYFKEPQVSVQVTDSRSEPVSVAGNVNTPGVVQLRGNRNLLEVISQAGGLRADAGDSGFDPSVGGFHRSHRPILRGAHQYTQRHERQRSDEQHPDQAARRNYCASGTDDLCAGQCRPAWWLCAYRE
jgi:protein involved in polysaccharide export with SLBB domain